MTPAARRLFLAATAALVLAGCSSEPGAGSPSSSPIANTTSPSTTAVSTTPPPPTSASPTPVTTTLKRTATPTPAKSSTKPTPKTSSQAAPTTGQSLPLKYTTGSATQVITVVASSLGDTTARLQAWTKTSGGHWVKHGDSVEAHVGTKGLTNSMSEYISATPMGSFTLTQAFGRDSNPGTSLPYFKTSPADWWVSQDKSTYNTHQVCTKGTDGNGCGYKDPSEHLYDEIPYYDYAVVINYNTSHPVYPRGSAVFLHVHPPGTGPTAGCVSIPVGNLVPIMKWLKPADHPRILIGLG